jgi:hypothetical protein
VPAKPGRAEPDATRWREYAAQLPPNARVTVRLTTGERIEGHVIRVTADALHIDTNVRNVATVRDLPFDGVQSIVREKEMSRGVKRGIWAVVIGVAAFIIISILAEATR